MKRPLDNTPLHATRQAYYTLEAALKNGHAERYGIFEVTTRALPEGDTYGLLAGVERVLENLATFIYDENALEYLGEFLESDTLDYLANLRFTGTVTGLREGDAFMANTPVITLECTYGEALVLGDAIVSMLNWDSAVATAAHQIRRLAGGRKLYDIATPELNEDAAIPYARAVAVGGFQATTNLLARLRYPDLGSFTGGVDTSFAGVFEDPANFYYAQLEATEKNLTVLVDSRFPADALDLIEDMVKEKTIPTPFAIRFNSGEPLMIAQQLRSMLDERGLVGTNIIYTGKLTRDQIRELAEADAPIESYGINYATVFENRLPTIGFRLNLIAFQDETYGPFRPVTGIRHPGGRRTIYRAYDDEWRIAKEILVADTVEHVSPEWHKPEILYMNSGKIVTLPTFEEIKEISRNTITTRPNRALTTAYLPAWDADKPYEQAVDEDEAEA